MANGNINVEAILSKRIIRFPVDDIMPDEKQIRKNVKAAIKEIVEAVIDKCAEGAKLTYRLTEDTNIEKAGFKFVATKDSILNVKTQIDYGN